MAFIYVLLLLCILLCTHGYYMFTCHCCQRFIYVNKLSCTTDEGLTTENFGSYHYTILHQNRTLSSFLSIHYWCGKHIYIYIFIYNSHPTLPMVVLTKPAGLGHRTLVDSQCSGNIARFRWISFNFIKTQLSIYFIKTQLFKRHPTPTMP